MSAWSKRPRKWALWKFTEVVGAESAQLGKGPLGRAFWKQAAVSLRVFSRNRRVGFGFIID
jgi:hypothetical protein